jgi:hypothetical protein
MTAIAADPATTPGYRRVSSTGESATALPESRVDGTWTLDVQTEPVPAWLSEVETRLNELLALDAGWDTYDAEPLEPSHIVAAVSLLLHIAPLHAPAPWIVPTGRRGVQLEWHFDDVDIEASVDDRGAYILVADKAGEAEGDPLRRPDLCERATRAIAMTAAPA